MPRCAISFHQSVVWVKEPGLVYTAGRPELAAARFMMRAYSPAEAMLGSRVGLDTPVVASTEITGSPLPPTFVVIRITPLAAREP